MNQRDQAGSASSATQRRVGVKHFITLRSEIPQIKWSKRSEQRSEPTVFRLTKEELPRECSCKELFLFMTWKLRLWHKCETNVYVDKQAKSVLRLTPQLEIVPDPEVKEKLGDVWIALRKTVYANGSSVPIKIIPDTCDVEESLTSVPCDDTIILKKEELYKCNLSSEDSQIVVLDNSRHSPTTKSIAFEVDIYPIKHTFGVIDPVAIPPCPVLQDLRGMLAFDEEESKQKFCDVIITCPATDEDDEDQLFEDNKEEDLEVEEGREEKGGNAEAEGEQPPSPPPPQQQQQSQEDGGAEEKGKEITLYAHKAILAARSAFFAKMFSVDMKESATNTIDLVDIEPDVLKELLTYIYSGECPNIETHAESLLYQAEKYELSHLKALCEERLSYDIQVDNAARILLLADTCNAKQLKWNSLLFIHEHDAEIRNTEDWGEVKKSRELLEDLFNAKCDREPPAKRPKLL